jgi:putative copper export protein
VALGGVNRFLVMPRLLAALRSEHLPIGPWLRCFLRVESLVLLAVLAAAAVLSGTEPASRV